MTRPTSRDARYRYQCVGSTDYSDGNGLPVGLDELGVQSIEAVLKLRLGG